MKKWNRTVNSIMITSVSITVIRFIVDYVDLKVLRPEVYAMRSAPWYTGGLVYGAVTLAIVLIGVVIKAIIRHKIEKGE